MGSFVAVLPCDGATADFRHLAERASRAITGKQRIEPDFRVSTKWSFAASCRRWNGGGAPIAVDPESGSWLAVVGTCFHESGNNQPENLLEQYLSVGAERLACDLDGFFAVIAGNAKTRETIVITDIVGSLHFYHRLVKSGVALSSSSLILSQLGAVSLDSVGCQEFLASGIMYEDRAFYDEIRKLPPATITTFANGHLSGQQRYWDAAKLQPDLLPAKQAADALWEELVFAVGKINKQFESVACDLTGGYDSRAVAAAFLGGHRKFATVVSGPADSADVVISRGLAAKLGLRHIHYPVSSGTTYEEMESALQLTDGEYDLVEYVNVARIHRDLSQRFNISINGSFGEIARGYWWELLFPRTGEHLKLDSGKLARRRYATKSCNTLFQPKYQIDLVEHIKGVVERSVKGLESYPNTFQMDIAYLQMRMQRWQGRIASSTNRIWPCLSPFMSRKVLEIMLQTRFAARERSFLIRLMLAKYQPALGSFPLEHGYPALPATWKTVPRFWRLLPHYATKVIHKVESRLVQDGPDPLQRTRSELWQSEQIRTLLNPLSMKSMAILDANAVAALLERSRNTGFSQGGEWNRLLTLEWAISRETASS